jgi:pilus assembly protein CpaB
MPLPRLRINPIWLLLGLAIIFGGIAVWLTSKYLQNKERRIEDDVNRRLKGGATVSVVVPTRDLPKGAPVDASLVAAREIQADLVYAETITAEQFDSVAGKKLLRAVEKGRPLRRADVIDDRGTEFADMVQKGRRAITIDIDENNSIAQMVRPGNLIDLLLIVPDASAASANGGTPVGQAQEIVTLLQSVKVVATGQTVKTEAGSVAGTTREQRYANVTLDLSPEDAARTALAQQMGRMRIVLRNPEDQNKFEMFKISTLNLYKSGPMRVDRTSSRVEEEAWDPKTVRYYVGGKSGGGGTANAMNVQIPAGAGISIPNASGGSTNLPIGAPAPGSGASAAAGQSGINVSIPYTQPSGSQP